MDLEAIKNFVAEFLRCQGMGQVAEQVRNSVFTKKDSDLEALLGLADLAGGKLLLQNRIKQPVEAPAGPA